MSNFLFFVHCISDSLIFTTEPRKSHVRCMGNVIEGTLFLFALPLASGLSVLGFNKDGLVIKSYEDFDECLRDAICDSDVMQRSLENFLGTFCLCTLLIFL